MQVLDLWLEVLTMKEMSPTMSKQNKLYLQANIFFPTSKSVVLYPSFGNKKVSPPTSL